MDNAKVIQLIDSGYDRSETVLGARIDIWMKHEVFSGLWWMGVFLTLIPWLIWIYLRPKKSTDRLLYVGFMVIIFSVIADVLGDQYGLWHYRFNVVPVMPTYLPWDLTLMPVTVLLLLQYKPALNPYLKAAVFALLAAYGAEPFFAWLTVYHPIHWRFSYSLPIHYVLFLAAYYMLRRNHFDPLPAAK